MRQLNTANTGIGGIEQEGKVPGFQHHDAMWFGADQHQTYRKLAVALVERFKPQRVLELGSGAGSLAYHLRDLGVPLVVTLDGNRDTLNSPFIKPEHHFIVRTDVPFELVHNDGTNPRFDLIISFEHFEHIDHSWFGRVIQNIRSHAAPDAVLVATASRYKYPPPLEHVHPNVKEREEWVKYLTEEGFTELPGGIIAGNNPFNFGDTMTSELVFRVN